MKPKKIRNLKKWRELLSYEESRREVQFIIVFVILGVVSFFMTGMNYLTHWETLMWATLVFGVACTINVILSMFKGSPQRIARVLFGCEIVGLFSYFVVMGEPEGFSAIWAALLPACGLLLYSIKYGTILSAIELVTLVFLLWTPYGNDLLMWNYTTSFKMRFPVLFIAFYMVGLFLEFTRKITQDELKKARDKIQKRYNEEKMNSRYAIAREKQRNYDIMKVLASEYTSVYLVNIKSGTLDSYQMEGASPKGNQISLDASLRYEESFKAMVNKFADSSQVLPTLNAGNINNVCRELEKTQTFKHVFLAKETQRYWELNFIKVENEDGIFTMFAVAMSDKDYEIRKEKQRQVELESALKGAEAASAAKTTFLFNMSHDIRTPMNAIIGFTDMAIKHQGNPEKVAESLEKVKTSSDHLLKLINDVLDMSRIESGKVEINESETNVIEIADQSISMMAQNAKDHNLTFRHEFRNIRNKLVYADVLHINEILINIIGNSVKYTKPGGKIDLVIEQLPDKNEEYATYSFKISDTGIGMSEEFIKNIFDAFSREKNSTVSGIQGTGLGMAITKRLIDLMQGTIDVKSKVDFGTTVTIVLDFRKSENENEAEQDTAPAPVVETSFEGKRLLLVDDNELNREIAKEILEDEGLIVDEAEDGSVSVEMLIEKGPNYYDYVLMDIQMPIMDGYEATKAIRAMRGYDKLPIIALTANAFEEDKRNAISAGMNAHLGKPLDLGKLFETLKHFS